MPFGYGSLIELGECNLPTCLPYYTLLEQQKYKSAICAFRPLGEYFKYNPLI